MKAVSRMEKDSIGIKEVPAEAYYGVQTLRAVENFHITGRKIHPDLVYSVAAIKKAAAQTNLEAGVLDEKRAKAICEACDEIMEGKFLDQFIVDPIQGGAGTSINMNANEVIANRAIEILGGEKGDYKTVHPNDHVNAGQSTNDVIPTAGKITVLRIMQRTENQLSRLKKALLKKADEFQPIVKMGRTQLQDAVPIRLGQEFEAYASAVNRDIYRLNISLNEMKKVNLGGTAIGTGLNADIYYEKNIVQNLEKIVELGIEGEDNLIDGTSNLDSFVAISGAVKACAVSLSKMANDLRLMSSGPRTGLGEINLPAKQNGSSIMPGKVNPVIPEVVNQVAFRIIGNDTTIMMAAEAGQLELNAFEPVLFCSLFESIDILGNAIATFIENCINGITANEKRCSELLENSVGIVTAICPYLGYSKAADIAKAAISKGQPVRKIILQSKLLKPEDVDRILDPIKMTEPGIKGRKKTSSR